MVPPIVHIQAKYYGWKVALYIAAIMFVSIVATALILNGLFGLLGITPESGRAVAQITQFKIDYTFWMNIVFILIAGWLIALNRQFISNYGMRMMEMEGGGALKRGIVYLFVAINIIGLFAYLSTNFW